jgi:hypothetical protein
VTWGESVTGSSTGVLTPGFGGPPISTLSATTGISVATTNTSTGGGLAHNNQPKSIVMNYIIKR